jgi:catechol 2,3-dioxygenase-like lactoylglutathione lyase family enzyme
MIQRLDHLVLTVRDVDATVAFYTDLLGMEAITFGNGRRALRFSRQKINLHKAGREVEPKAERPVPGSADLCFITAVPIETVLERIRAADVPVVEGPVKRTGANGPIRSVCLRDPDGNLLEVANNAA